MESPTIDTCKLPLHANYNTKCQQAKEWLGKGLIYLSSFEIIIFNPDKLEAVISLLYYTVRS